MAYQFANTACFYYCIQKYVKVSKHETHQNRSQQNKTTQKEEKPQKIHVKNQNPQICFSFQINWLALLP